MATRAYDLDAELDVMFAAYQEQNERVTPRLVRLIDALEAREDFLRFTAGMSSKADQIRLEVEGLRLRLGFHELSPAEAADLTARFLVAPEVSK